MDITRPIANIAPLPPKRDDADTYSFGRRSASTPGNAPIDSDQNLAARRPQPQPHAEVAKQPPAAPIQLRDIQQTFVSSREIEDTAHSPYSAQFLAQQFGQQTTGMASAHPLPLRAHGRAAAAYDNSLSLTAIVIGFEGRAERFA